MNRSSLILISLMVLSSEVNAKACVVTFKDSFEVSEATETNNTDCPKPDPKPDPKPEVLVSKVNPTGIQTCGDYAFDDKNRLISGHTHSNAETCSLTKDNEGDAIVQGQDGLTAQTMSFEKVPGQTDKCVIDKTTGLMWEIKHQTGLHDAKHLYSWYATVLNGGQAGNQNVGKCLGSRCDTQAFIQAVNDEKLCGFTNWRLPTRYELRGLVNYSKHNPAIDTAFFPNIQPDFYWSSDSVINDTTQAWAVDFNFGYTGSEYKTGHAHVMLVRDNP